MCFIVKLTFTGLLISIYIHPLLSTYNYKIQHPSEEILSEPGFLPELNWILNRFGSMHTMREQIYWAIKEETISKILYKKLNCVRIEQMLIQKYLRQGNKFTTYGDPRFSGYFIRMKLNRIKNLNDINLDTNKILKLRWKKMYGLWVDSRDMYLSVTGLLMIQKMYFWQPVKILKDISPGSSYQAVLTPIQTLVIGMCSLFKRMYTFAVEWFEVAEYIARRQQTSLCIANSLATQMRDLSVQQHNKKASEFECSITYDCHMNLFIKPIHFTSKETYKVRLSRRKKMLPKYSRLGTVGIAEDQLINLCSGSSQSILPPEMQNKLKCYYEKSRHPYLYISPVKTEQLSESPIVYQYYDILGPKFIEELKYHFVENADLITLVNNVQYYNRERIFEQVDPTPGYAINITEKYVNHPIFTKFAEMVTGLKFYGPAENLQYMDYIPGRGIRAHEDVHRAFPMDPEKEIDGNRFADLLYYLELPKVGGYTPFCQAGVRAHLVKGSMVIWINKFRNGTNRNDAYHGACPVIHGNKMILAQGIKYTGQENHFKCTLNQFE